MRKSEQLQNSYAVTSPIRLCGWSVGTDNTS